MFTTKRLHLKMHFEELPMLSANTPYTHTSHNAYSQWYNTNSWLHWHCFSTSDSVEVLGLCHWICEIMNKLNLLLCMKEIYFFCIAFNGYFPTWEGRPRTSECSDTSLVSPLRTSWSHCFSSNPLQFATPHSDGHISLAKYIFSEWRSYLIPWWSEITALWCGLQQTRVSGVH